MKAALRVWLAFGAGMAVALALAGGWYWYSLQPGAAAPAMTATPGSKAPARVPLQLGQGQAAQIGLRLAPVASGQVAQDMRVVATVAPDESRISHIHTRVAGWIEKLHVATTGEAVRAGQPIVDIFSQELFASQVEYLAARRLSGPPSQVADSGRARLKFFGMGERAIASIEQSGQPLRVVTLVAPHSGIIAHRGIAAGTSVDPSTEIATVLDLSRVWVFAELPASSAGLVRKGMPVRFDTGDGTGATLPAVVEFVDPMLSESTRTLRVRFSLPNGDGRLRPGQYGTAWFSLPPRTALVVPRDALVDLGEAQYVYVAQPDGRYVPRPVRAGARLADTVEIVDGVRAGEMVVSEGVFLLDSESRLRASGQGAGHGGHGSAPAAPPGAGHGAAGTTHD